jgi:isocitrate dehydrogenase (NAD+)
MTTITLIAGDGIGPEVTAAARAVVDASGVGIVWEEAPAGMEVGKASGNPLPESVFQSLERNRVALKGPTQTPFGEPYRVWRDIQGPAGRLESHIYPSVTIALRREFELFANVRPIKNYPNAGGRYQGVDVVLFRENTEDLYLGLERMVDPDTAEAVKRITRAGCLRIARFAADYMQRTGRKRVTIGHKSNVLKLTDGMFLQVCQETCAASNTLEVDSRVIDALCMELVVKPETFDCLLLPNLYGDIVSDLAAGLVGGLGIAPGANIGARHAMFEAVHGSAPDIAGRDIANPMSMILSAVMMLRYLGEGESAGRIERALAAVLAAGKTLTRDLGGSAGTRAMTAAIVERLGRQADQLNFSPAALTMALLLSISFAIRASNSVGVSGMGSIPCGLNFSMMPGWRSTFIVSSCRRLTMSRGVFAGTSMPFQNV